MAASLSQLIIWRDSLIESRMSGVYSVTDQNGERITYRTDGEMARAIAAAESMIAAVGRPRGGTFRVQTSKGL
ncbi:hypothetical protein QBK99_03340 [Corticibacterium sp. UT-5YL-CI-8]|nr:hypothetical protein [Tianweitania sp. UT-5YL-CI-8]